MISKEQIVEIVERGLKEGQFLVDVAVNPGNKIVVTIDHNNGISLDDCVVISRQIDSSLDREKEDFELEVSSPGLLSPFKVPQQYIKNIGKEIEVLFKNGEKIKGTLMFFNDTKFGIETEEIIKEQKKKKVKSTIEVEMDTVKQSKLVLSF